MRIIKLIVLALVAVVSLGSIIYLFSTSKNITQQDQNRKEGVICGSTLEPRCYKYRCETGYLPNIPPPGGPGFCSDGSRPTQLEEVSVPR